MALRYRLVFRGKYLPGLSQADVVANLASLFKTTAANVESLLAARPAIIKQDIDIESGNRYVDVLLEAGLITHLEPLEGADPWEVMASGGWDGVERRIGERERRKIVRERRGVRRGASIQPDRRSGGGRRSTD